MKTFKLFLAAMLLFVLSLATFNSTNAQTNSSIVHQVNINEQVTGSAVNSTSGQSDINDVQYLAMANLDNHANRNNTKKNATKAINTTNVTLSYTDNLPGGVGHLLYVEFKQNGSTVYTFQNYQINGATVPQGNYTIVLHISNPLEYTTYSTSCIATNWQDCKNYYLATYLVQEVAANLTTSTTLAFISNTFNCSSGDQ